MWWRVSPASWAPPRAEGRDLVVGHFTDPEGTLLGVAGPAPAPQPGAAPRA